jgi:CysZ protein
VSKLVTAIERTGQQIFDRAFLKVFLLGLVTTVGAIIIAYLAANEIMKEIPGYQSDWEWWEDFVNWIMGYTVDIAFFIILFFSFAPISTIFVSIYLDDIVDSVEDRFYPENKANKRLGIPKLAFLASRIALLVVVLNIIVIPLYIIFFWVPFLPIGIFYLLNGYLLGLGYYEMVAVRHMGIKEAGIHRRSIRGVVLGVGLIMTFLFMVPIVQLIVPIIGAALICHLFHMSRFEET